MNVLGPIISYVTGSQQEAVPSYLTELPTEVALCIWNQLEPRDIASLNQTCRTLRNVKNDDPSLPGYKLRGKLKVQLSEIILRKWHAEGIRFSQGQSGIGQLMQLSSYAKKEILVPVWIGTGDLRQKTRTTKQVDYKVQELRFPPEDSIDSAKETKAASLKLEMILSDAKKVEKKNFLRQRYVDGSCDEVYYVEKMTLEESNKSLPDDVRALLPELQAFVDKVVADLVEAVHKQTMTESRIL